MGLVAADRSGSRTLACASHSQFGSHVSAVARAWIEHPLGGSVFALNKEGYVAIARIVKTQITPDEYEQMRERLGMGDAPPPGGLFHVAAVGEDGKIHIVEVWDSREEAEAWAEKVAAARNEAGFGDSPPTIEYLDVHRVVQR